MPNGTLKEIEIQGVGRFQVPDEWDDARIKQHILHLQVSKPEIFGQQSAERLQAGFRAQREPVEQAAELPGAAKMGGIEAAPERSMLQKFMEVVRRGPVGEALAGTKLGRMLGMETDVVAALRDPDAPFLPLSKLAPKETLRVPSPGGRFETLPPPPAEAPELTGAITGGLEFAESFTRPSMVMLLSGLGMTAKAAPILGRFISGGFSAHMMKSLFDQYPELKVAAESDDPREFWRVGTQMGLTGLMAFVTGKHAIKGRAAPAELPYVTRLKELGYEDFQIKQMLPSQAVEAIATSKGPQEIVSPGPLKPEIPADVMERARLEELSMAEGAPKSFADIPEAGVRAGEPMMVRPIKRTLKPLSRTEKAALEAQYLENIPEEAQRGYEAGEMDKMFLGQPEAPAEPRLVMAPTDVTKFFEPPTPTSRQLPAQAGPSREIPGRLPGAAQAKEAIPLPAEMPPPPVSPEMPAELAERIFGRQVTRPTVPAVKGVEPTPVSPQEIAELSQKAGRQVTATEVLAQRDIESRQLGRRAEEPRLGRVSPPMPLQRLETKPSLKAAERVPEKPSLIVKGRQPLPLVKEMLVTAKRSVEEIRGRVSNVKSGPIESGAETILFDLGGKPYKGVLRGRNRDLVLGVSDKADSGIAARVLLDRDAKPIGRVEKPSLIMKGLTKKEVGKRKRLIERQKVEEIPEVYQKMNLETLKGFAKKGVRAAKLELVRRVEKREISVTSRLGPRNAEAGKIIGEALVNPLKPLLELYTRKAGAPAWAGIEVLLKKISPEFLKRAMVERYGQPEAFKLADLLRIIETTKGGRKGMELGKRLTTKLSQVEQQSLGRFIRGEMTEADLRRVRTDPRFDDAIEAAKEARQAFDELGGQAVTQGLLSDKTFFENYGRYMPRLYRKYEVDHGALLAKYGLKKPTRLDLARFKMRKDIPEEIRVLMGEILEPGYPVAKGIVQITADIERMKLFRTVAGNKDWVSDQPIEGFSKLPLPDTAKLGPLRGKYVQKYIYEELERIVRIPRDAERIGRSLVGEWKASKVLLNPATHGRNMMSNMVLAWLGGLSPTRVDIFHKAYHQLRHGGKDFTAASDGGLFRTTFTEAELSTFGDAWTQSTGSLFERFGKMADLLDGLKVEKAERIELLKKGKPLTAIAPRLKAKAARIYELEEQFFKLAKYIHNKERGMNTKEAIADAEHWLFNYQEVPKFIDWARRSPLSPTSWFITFTYKALPVVAESAIKYPWRLGSIMLMLEGIQKVSEKVLGVGEEEKRRIEFAMPERMKAKPSWLRRFLMLFVKDRYDQYIYWDLTYTLPWGDLGEVGGEGTWAHPLLFAPTWRIAAELMLNESAWTGREIWSDADLPSEKVRKALLHFYRAIAPSLAPGGWSETKLRRALKGELDYWGRETSLTSAIASSLLGFKTVSLNVNKAIFFKIKDFQAKVEELKKRGFSISNNKGMSDEKKLKEFQKLRLVYEQLVKRYSNKEKK